MLLRQKRQEVGVLLTPLQKALKVSVIARLRLCNGQCQQTLPRYMLLVLMGASRTGKSTLALSLGKVLEFGDAPLAQTVQSAEPPVDTGQRPTPTVCSTM